MEVRLEIWVIETNICRSWRLSWDLLFFDPDEGVNMPEVGAWPNVNFKSEGVCERPDKELLRMVMLGFLGRCPDDATLMTVFIVEAAVSSALISAIGGLVVLVKCIAQV